jgi:diketogulonate reductase-like aldo/keto reductase
VNGAGVPPAFVQNRCYARTGWDANVRSFCRERGILYQGFSLLTANRRELASRTLARVARDTGGTPEQVVFRFALEVGMLPLTGTTQSTHMRLDRACLDLAMEARHVETLERISSLE